MLEPFFNPHGVAVIGASRDPYKLGYGVVRNLAEIGYRGPVYPVNPAATHIMGYACYPSVADVPDPVDLAVVIVPAPSVVSVIEQCAERGIGHIIVASGGFGETGPEGRRLEADLAGVARKCGVRIVGPNCNGIIDTYTPISTAFTVGTPRSGDIGLVSQSGALCVVLMNIASHTGNGFSRLVSLGNQVDVSEAEILTSLAGDPHTHVIAAYIEGVVDGRAFMRAAEEAARRKPVVAIKAGHSSGGAKAVTSHTGALAGSAEAYAAAFRQCGVVQVDTMEGLFDCARTLAWQPLPQGNRVALLTNAGGVGILAADALEAAGLRLASLSDETRGALRLILPAAASVDNPVDVLAGSGSGIYAIALNSLLADAAVDAVLVIVAPPQDWYLPTSVAEVIAEVASLHAKPVLASMMGLDPVDKALAILSQRRIPNFAFPERAASPLAAMVTRQQWLEAPVGSTLDLSDVESWRSAARVALDKGNLEGAVAAYGIALPPGRLTSDADSAVQAAEEIGYPVALKLMSSEVSHKSDVGGVALDVGDEAEVRAAFSRIVEAGGSSDPGLMVEGVLVQKMLAGGQEVIVGVRRDPQFGPLVLVGSGGVEVELMRDVAVGIGPLTRVQAEDMLDATQAGMRLKGWRGVPPGDWDAVLEAMMRLAQAACDFPAISELEINPLYVLPQGQGALAVDVRGVLE